MIYFRNSIQNVYQQKIALYCIDCVKKILLNHQVSNELIFDRLDEAREAEIENDREFWQHRSSGKSFEENQITQVYLSFFSIEYLTHLFLFLIEILTIHRFNIRSSIRSKN